MSANVLHSIFSIRQIHEGFNGDFFRDTQNFDIKKYKVYHIEDEVYMTHPDAPTVVLHFNPANGDITVSKKNLYLAA